MRISLTNFKLLSVFLFVSVFLGKIIIAQDDHTVCMLVAEDKDYFTYVEPPLYFKSTPKANRVSTATINVTYIGFSGAAQTAFQYAVDILETEITSSVTIELIANWISLGAGILGSAGANYIARDFPSAPLSNTWYSAALANKLAGFDLSAADHDINANFNSDFANWYFGTDMNTPAGQYDFVSVVLHEIIHGLGFSGSMTVSGGVGSWGNSGFPYVYDVNAVNGSDQSLLNTMLFPNLSTALGTQLTNNNIFFNGTNAVIGNGGTTNPKLYTPGTWNPGSSYSHWDDATYPAGNINSLMTHAIGSAEAIHHPGFITRGLLKDSGWTINLPVPVELSAFSAKVLRSGGIGLDWRTETEVDNYGFDILRRTQENEWEKIGFVDGHGNSNSPKEYSFLDEGVSYGVYFYRLKQIDNDGTFEYSKVIEVDIDAPIVYELSQNYPNPFNPETTIKFSVAEAAFVKLSYYNILGELKGTIVNEFKEAGIHTVNFNASELTSGIYVYKLEIDDFIQMRKMVLIK